MNTKGGIVFAAPDSPTPALVPGSFSGVRVLILGLGRFGGGVAVTRWTAKQGAQVTVADQSAPESLAESVATLADCDIAYRFGAHRAEDLDGVELVVVNPAVNKAKSEFFSEILRRRVPWTTELNLFCERCPALVVGVTGTYGKSTTCAMIAHVLDAGREQGEGGFTRIRLGGNIGRSLLADLNMMRATDVVVLEMSNAQLEDLPRISFAPQVAVITNLSPHHLDRYDSYAEYLRAKLNIIGAPDVTRTIVLGALDQEAEHLLQSSTPDWESRLRRVTPLCPLAALMIPGDHNQTNAACAAAVCRSLQLPESVIRAALQTFPGLPHRIEWIGQIDGVDYYNDSKSTSPSATIVALKALARPVVAIVGGQRKDVPLDACAGALGASCRAVICVGESGPNFAAALRHLTAATGCVLEEAQSLEEAVAFARKHARSGDAILFSPGAPSFDAYPNFEFRGRHFAQVVKQLSSP